VARRQTNHLTFAVPDMLYTMAAFATGISEVNMANGRQKDWRELCIAVTNESDSTKLSSLVQELIEALDQGERNWRHSICPLDAIPTSRDAA